MKSKRAKACEIPMEVKEAVYERDNGRCIICGRPGIPNAHYIRRSDGGLGIVENVVTLCLTCHARFDNGDKREEYGTIIKDYLDTLYPDFSDSDRRYKKYQD